MSAITDTKKVSSWDQFCVATTGACWPNVPTFGWWGDMSPTCRRLSQPSFPDRSFKNMQYIFVAYVYDLNVIIVRAMPTRTNAAMITAFKEVIPVLRTRRYRPALNLMDNKCSTAVEQYICSEKINIQLVPPHNHRANASERAITTFKEHFIAALATVDQLCPLQLWDEFLPQVELTLNMLRFSCHNPKISANQEVYGAFNFNKTPLAPLGTKALIYDDPT
jgi:hypothetical protein